MKYYCKDREEVLKEVESNENGLTSLEAQKRYLNDLDETIEGLIDSIPDVKTRKQIKVEFRESTTFERLSTSVLQMCSLLELTEEQINEMWELGLTQ